ncbi:MULTISPECIES: hypothetical protein [Myxococcus]|uniref:hypothetical protein n=1 Tax=Myxococcus TaxID=32 RepID=UPI00089C183C|nr:MULTISPECIES: hypothetical protein [Myxococcus]NOJ53460.1 hypothetical protein [Myxococcus xanthus]QPM80870.1 hypothetical protein I5Q59_06110 [Myxococcus xanthus]QVW69930.1 hypothetical protein JTM82_10400 [Myxococcus xanthus DZ2]QZZ48754.1 hypothetical protein MyxoNM_06040 [Myxococcus xanthus]UEO03941.1 hypothetical protein K1515_32410 [Myxococcus xanthus DZ2]
MPEWIKLLIQILGPAVATAIIVGRFSLRFNNMLEHTKRDLQDSLASRARRADYLRNQIEKLYGPLSFLLETTNARVECADELWTVANAQQDQDKAPPGTDRSPISKKAYEVQDKFYTLALDTGSETIKLLHSGWAWLDEDDQADVLSHTKDMDRNKIEFTGLGSAHLPIEFYNTENNPHTALAVPSIRNSSFAKRIRQKLAEKQRELSGLTQTPNWTSKS